MVSAGVLLAALLVGGAWAAPAPPDRQAPTKPTIDGPVSSTILRPVFTFGATDGRTPRGKLRFRCAFDGAALRPCARIHRPVATFSFGEHSLRVRALDLAGNASRVTSFSFRVVGRWDAAVDFERAPRPANPGRDRYGNSAWFYLYSGTPAHDPADYHLLPHFALLAPDWEVWYGSAGPTQTAGTQTGFNNARMIMHPGHWNLGQNAVLGWRSPVATLARVFVALEKSAGACGAPENGVAWSVDHGATIVRSGSLGPGATATVNVTIPVAAGESLYVVINDAGDSNCDTVLVEMTVETT